MQVEVVFVDDGSSDRGEYVIHDLLNGTSVSYKIIKKRNGGVSSARNMGMRTAIGKYIMFVDCDDGLLNKALETVKSVIMTDGLDAQLIMFEYLPFSEKDKLKANQEAATNCLPEFQNKKTILAGYLSGRDIKTISVCSCVYQAELLKSCRVEFDEKLAYAEDQKFLLTVISLSNSIMKYRSQILAYINYANSATGQLSMKWFDSVKMFKSLKSNQVFQRYIDLIDLRINGELVTIANKFILGNNLKKSVGFIEKYILPERDGSLKLTYIPLFLTPRLYVLLYKLYRKFK